MWTGLLNRWKALAKKQRLFILLTTAGLVVIIAIGIIIIAIPKYVPLSSSTLSSDEFQMITGTLYDNGIPYKASKAGQGVLVQKQDYNKATQLIVNNSDIQLTDDFKLADALSSINMSTTTQAQNEIFKAAAASRATDLVKALSYIQTASVQIDLPENTSYFLDLQKTGTASVVVKGRRTLTRADGETIAGIVASMFTDINKENVQVTDTDGNVLYNGVTIADNSTVDNSLLAYQQEYESIQKTEVEKRVKALFDSRGGAVVAANLVFDFSDNSEQWQNYYNPIDQQNDTGYVNSTDKESANGTSASTEGEPGVGSNDLTTPTYDMGSSSGNQVSQSKNVTDYLYNLYTKTTNSNNLGQVDLANSSIAVTLPSVTTYTQDTVTDAELNGMTWAQFKNYIANQKEVYTPADVGTVALVQDATGLSKVSVSYVTTVVCVDAAPRAAKSYTTIILMAVLVILIFLLAFGLIRKQQPDEVTEVEPELSVEDLLVSTQLEEEKEMEEKKMADLKEIELQMDSDIKRQIDKFVSERPEAVAQLLRNWLNEDWD